jgi:hypothetical protein
MNDPPPRKTGMFSFKSVILQEDKTDLSRDWYQLEEGGYRRLHVVEILCTHT